MTTSGALGETTEPASEATTALAAPGVNRARITGIDVARGLALLGMAATHMLAVQDEFTGHLTTVGWLFAGRASALFAVLAGVSLAIVSGGATPRVGSEWLRATVTIAVRAGLIGLVGLWLAGIGTPVAVILAYYALLFLLSLPFLGLRAPTLVALAAVWAVASPMVSHLWRQQLDGGPNDQVTFDSFSVDPVAALQELFVLGYYPALTWMTYMFAGLAVGRMDLRARRTAVWLVLVGAVLAAGAWVSSALILAGGMADRLLPPEAVQSGVGWWDLLSSEAYGTTPTDAWEWLTLAAPHTGTSFDLIGTTGSALAVLGLCLLLVRVPWVKVLTHPVAAAGSMTLTLYTVHVFALAQPWGEWDSASYYLTHVVVALTAATVWLHFARRGPMEWWVHLVSSAVGLLVTNDDSSEDVPRS